METHMTCEAVSIGSAPVTGTDAEGNDTFETNGSRSVTLMNRPGDSSDPYGGWKQCGSVHDAPKVIMPDGSTAPDDKWPALGYEDDDVYRVIVTSAYVRIEVV